ncbi:hypothetical protein [Helicobacter pylori]|uniref:hypothetical protein n=1 Tax=Helicobacter pylori TaxID=210 RepID=UPI0013CE02AD|nr:hypothetical protein [Helicobacter pylori]
MKNLDFSGNFLSVIRNLVGVLFQNTPLRVLQPSLKRSHRVTKLLFLPPLLKQILKPF